MNKEKDPGMTLLEDKLGALTVDGSRVSVALQPIVDAPRDRATDTAVLALLESHDEIVLDFKGCEKVDSAWLRILRRLSAEGAGRGVKVLWSGVPTIVRQTADLMAIVKGIEFVDTPAKD